MFQRDQLRKQQERQFSMLHKQAKEQEKKLEEKEVANIEEVEQAVQHNLELPHVQEEELEGTLGLVCVARYDWVYL